MKSNLLGSDVTNIVHDELSSARAVLNDGTKRHGIDIKRDFESLTRSGDDKQRLLQSSTFQLNLSNEHINEH